MSFHGYPTHVHPRKTSHYGRVAKWLVDGGRAKKWKCYFCDYRARTFEELRRHTTEAHPRDAKR